MIIRLSIIVLLVWMCIGVQAQQLNQIQKGTAKDQMPVTNGKQYTQVYRDAIPYILDTIGIRDSILADVVPDSIYARNDSILLKYGRGSVKLNNISGTGVATRVAFWDGTNSLSSNANLYWDNSSIRLGVRTSSPVSVLDVNGTATIRENADVNTTSVFTGFRRIIPGLNHGVTNKLPTDMAWGLVDYSGISYPNMYLVGVGKGSLPVMSFDLIRLDNPTSAYLGFDVGYRYGNTTVAVDDWAEMFRIRNNGVDKFKIWGSGDVRLYGALYNRAYSSGTSGQVLTSQGAGAWIWTTPNAGTVTSIATTDGITGGPITSTGTLGLTGQALALHNHAFNGLLVRTGSGTFSSRQLMHGSGISITNGNGISGDPTITNTGVLTFNGNTGAVTGVTGVTASSPLASSGGTAPNISMTQSGTSTNGWLSSTDWNIFNGKEPAITAGTTSQYWRGDKTWQTLNTTVVPEGTNQYFTNARARTAISLTTTGTSGAATYNSSTGVFNIPQYAGLGSFSATSPLIYNGAGNFSIQNATTVQSGALTSTDWNIFNNKVGGTGINTRIPYWTGTNTQSSTPYYYDNILGALVIPTGQSVYFPGNSTIIDKNNSGGAANEILSRATSGGGLDWIAIPDVSSTNELQTISTNTSPGNITLSGGGGTLNLNVNDADASNINEGYIGVTAGGASSSVIQGYNSSGTATGVGVTINAGSGLSITESVNTNGGSITLSATGGSGTVTSVGLSEGSGITITGTNPITSSGSMTIARKVEAGQLSVSSISVPSTETVINFTNEDTESNIDTDAANNRIIVSTSGIYQINFSGYIVPLVSGVDRTVVLTLRKDGSEINSQIIRATYGSTTNDGNVFSMSEVVNLSFSDIIDATFYYSTGGSGSSINLYNARLSVHKL